MKLTRVPNPWDVGSREILDLQPATVRELVDEHGFGEGTEIALNGRRLAEDELCLIPAEGSSLLLTPKVRGIAAALGLPWLIGLAVEAVTLFVLGTVYQMLTAPKREPLLPGDETSPTYSWSGVGTGYGPGYRIPLVYGEHFVGGVVIASRVRVEPGGTNGDVLEVIVGLCDGRVQSIGGETGGSAGEKDDYGTIFGKIPTSAFPEVYVDGNLVSHPGATAGIRCGSLDQTPFPSWPNSSTAIPVNAQLDDLDQQQQATIPIAEARWFAVKFTFPGGLWKQAQTSPTLGRFAVGFKIEWRQQDSAGWVLADQFTFEEATRSRLTFERHITLADIDGPFVVRITRTTSSASGQDYVQSSCTWTTLTAYVPGTFAYPRMAMLRLAMLANDRRQNSIANIVTRVKGRRVRVWDATLGFSDPTYELPASGSFSGIWTFPPGRNPGWIALDFATSKEGMLPISRNWSLDLQSFRDFADHCDVSLSGEMQFACDVVLDSGDDWLTSLQRICRIGRGIPLLVGNRLKIVYEYRDAHGRGANSVPARGRVAVISSANMEECEITQRDTVQRPNIYDVQILNAALDYEQDLIAVEDVEAFGLNEPHRLHAELVRREVIDLFGCTSASQARREGIYAHRVNRLSRHECRVVAGIDQAALELKDIFGLEFHRFRPFAQSAQGTRTLQATSSTSIFLDHPITVDSGIAPTFVNLVDTSNVWQAREVLMADGTYPAGTAITIASSVDVAKGVPVVVGYQDMDLVDFIVVGITRRPDGKREITGVEWRPDAWTIPSDFSTATGQEDLASAGVGPEAEPSAPEAASVALDAAGATAIGWRNPDAASSRQARLFLATEGDAHQRLLTQAAGGVAVVEGLEPHRRYILRATSADANEAFHLPAAGLETAIVAPEFRAVQPGAVQNLTTHALGDAVAFHWDHVSEDDLDYYEIRLGSTWVGAEILTRTRDNHWRWHSPGYMQSSALVMVRAKLRRGVYGPMDSAGIVWTGPSGCVLGDTEVDLTTAAAGTPTNCAFDPTDLRLRINTGKYQATYVGPTLTLPGSAARAYWMATFAQHWIDLTSTVDEDDRLVGSDEEMWAFVDGREPSEHAPGCDLETTVDDDDGLVDDDLGLVHGNRGGTGAHARAWLEVAWDTGAGFGAYEHFYPQERYAQQARFRLQLRRHDERYQLNVHNLVTRVVY